MPDDTAATTRFVILAAPRSGSNLLCTLLQSHPEILCHHEVFNPSGIYYALDYRGGSLDLATIDEREQAPLEFLARIWATSLGHSCVGFKMTRGQNELVLDKVLHDRFVHKIVLRRRNRIKTFVSSLIAEQSGQWEVYNRAELVESRPTVELKVSELHQHIAANETYYARIDAVLRSTGQIGFDIAYEELTSRAEHARLLEFLDVDDRTVPLAGRSIKQNPNDLRRLVANYNEVAELLRGTDLDGELRGMMH